MITILRKEGWKLNPNDKVVNSILKRVEANNEECPCSNPGVTHEDRCCPCKEYRENNVCHCTLYVREPNKYILPNRYGANVWLQENLEGGYYTLESDTKYCKEYLRIVGDDCIKAIDPPGGPFLSIGCSVSEGIVIDKIVIEKGKGLVIYLKNEAN